MLNNSIDYACFSLLVLLDSDMSAFSLHLQRGKVGTKPERTMKLQDKTSPLISVYKFPGQASEKAIVTEIMGGTVTLVH